MINISYQDLGNLVSSKLTETDSKIISELKDLETRLGPNGDLEGAGGIYANENAIRKLRHTTILRFLEVKNDLNSAVLRLLRRTSKMDDLEELHKMQEESEMLTAQIAKAESNRTLAEESNNLPHYDKYLLYDRDAKQNQRSVENQAREDVVTTAVSQLHQGYRQKKILFYIIGVLVSLGCAAADYSIIYSVFIAANMSVSSARLTALLAATFLDVPPYLLAVVITERHDWMRLIQIQQASTQKIEPGKRGRILIISEVVLIVSIILIFAAYVFLRILMFFGGGDFDTALHAVLNGELRFENSVFNSADLLSIAIPFGTSAVALAVGFLLSVPYSDYVQRATVFISEKLNQQVQKYNTEIAELNANKRFKETSIIEKKQSIWSTYIGDEMIATYDDKEFTNKVVQAYREIALPHLLPEYKDQARHIREKTETLLLQINHHLLPHAPQHYNLTTMDIDDEEQMLLKEIWNTDEETQTAWTQDLITQIDSDIKNFQAQRANSNA